MKRFIHVAAIQMEIAPLDVEANLAKAEQLLKQALASQKLDLVVFPEDCMTGPIPYNLEYALDTTSAPIEFFKKLASAYNVFIVCGSFIRKEDGRYYNTSLLINRQGEVILEYDKNNLWITERRYLTPGTELPVVKTSIGTIGLTICWDLANPNVFRQLAKQGADIICCPSYWTTEDGGRLTKKYPDTATEATMIDTFCPARAMENEVLLIYANGAKKGDIFLKTKKLSTNQVGHSQICAPVYGTVKKLSDNSEGFIAYTYDRHLALDAEKNYLLNPRTT